MPDHEIFPEPTRVTARQNGRLVTWLDVIRYYRQGNVYAVERKGTSKIEYVTSIDSVNGELRQ